MGIQVNIVGVGLGQEEFLTQEAKRLLENANVVYTTARIGINLSPLLKEIVEFKVGEILGLIEDSKEDMVIMVSGDTGFYSLSKTIGKGLKNKDIQVNYINGISSMQYLFAKLQRGYEHTILASAHGRKADLVALSTYHAEVFALTGGEGTVPTICQKFLDAGMDFLNITLGENLGSQEERILHGNPKEIMEQSQSELAVLLIENPKPTNRHTFIKDEELERGNAPMTKEEIRQLSVAKLNILPQDIVYDIGAGTGSVTLEMAKRAYESRVYAIEQKEEALELIQNNQKKLGIYNVELRHGKAPDKMEDWPAPHKVFVGGSGKNMGSILKECVDKHRRSYEQLVDKSKYKGPRHMDLVINTITLESLAETVKLLEKGDYQEVEYVSISSAKSKKVGGYHMMMANNPIYIISARHVFQWLDQE